MTEDKFALLGLERRYDVDREELDRHYRDLSRKYHPDRFATAPAAERTRSLLASTALNDAYRILKDPVRRAEHLLELGGQKLTERETVEPSFLMEIMELREALAEADPQGRASLTADVRARWDAAMAAIAQLFAQHGELAEVKKQLIALRYYQRFLDETEAGNGPGEHD